MKTLLVVTGAVVLLSGCSSTPQIAERPPYCTTDETVVLENGQTVNSKTVVECTDDQIKKLTRHRLGFTPNCGNFTYWPRKGGYDVQRQGLTCQKPDGSWEIVHTAGY